MKPPIPGGDGAPAPAPLHAVPAPAARRGLAVRHPERARALVRRAHARHGVRGGGLLPARLRRTRAELSPVTVELSAFTASVAGKRGLDLWRAPFAAYEAQISSKTSYADSQLLGREMRAAGIDVFTLHECARSRAREERGAVHAVLRGVEAERAANVRVHGEPRERRFPCEGRSDAADEGAVLVPKRGLRGKEARLRFRREPAVRSRFPPRGGTRTTPSPRPARGSAYASARRGGSPSGREGRPLTLPRRPFAAGVGCVGVSSASSAAHAHRAGGAGRR